MKENNHPTSARDKVSVRFLLALASLLTLLAFGQVTHAKAPHATSMTSMPEKEQITVTPLNCPGLNFVDGVVITGEDLDIDDLCNFLAQGGLTTANFEGPNPPLPNKIATCVAHGGIWDSVDHRCIFPLPKPTPTPSGCPSCSASSKREAVLVRFKKRDVVILVKPGSVKKARVAFSAGFSKDTKLEASKMETQ